MIIGNNSFNQNNNFQSKMNSIKNNASNMEHSSSNTTTHTSAYKDINNKNEMIDKSIEMLEQRLRNGLITHEEFQKQCAKLGKLRK